MSGECIVLHANLDLGDGGCRAGERRDHGSRWFWHDRGKAVIGSGDRRPGCWADTENEPKAGTQSGDTGHGLGPATVKGHLTARLVGDTGFECARQSQPPVLLAWGQISTGKDRPRVKALPRRRNGSQADHRSPAMSRLLGTCSAWLVSWSADIST